ncbi:unnamed protein product [Rotaria magnacalcarata]|uniref:Uncharacterized protein n=1 Tax=Rotaria magnacalcarata TaxID=392030 RepID=A0A816YLR9_9BILA|nr:unnamed protein product [Rotaria magnacalcarata]CAF2161923.1 unnamed protein product [Rotaria magnacalcarata]CAF3838956.1 unnamed protein product [Rotaria magnacalcarata]CAF3921578.1 unnamed protein product [Rotaria magnacalcarata]
MKLRIHQKLNFIFDLPKDKEYRVSPLYFDSNVHTILGATALSELVIFNDNRYHQAEIPGVNGITNARYVARLYASLIDDVGGGKQKRLLNKEIMKKATTSNTPDNETDRVRGCQNSFAMGFQLFDDDLKTFSHEEAGGSIGFAASDKSCVCLYSEPVWCEEEATRNKSSNTNHHQTYSKSNR